MNKQTIINRYFDNCQNLRNAFCAMPLDVQNYVTDCASLNAMFSNVKFNETEHADEWAIIKEIFGGEFDHIKRTRYASINVFAQISRMYYNHFKYTLYSYGTHFPLVIFDITTNTYYLNHTRYSSSTSSHQSTAFSSIPNRANVIHCDFECTNTYNSSYVIPENTSLHFTSLDALLAHREDIEKQRKFECKARAYGVAFSDDFYSIIRYKIFDSAKDGDFSGVKRSLKKWIKTKSFVKYSVFEAMTKQDYFVSTLETSFLWDWFVKEVNKSIRKYADNLQSK